MQVKKTTTVMDRLAMRRTLVRISHEVLERNNGTAHIALVGIQRRGVYLAKRIAAIIKKNTGCPVPVGILDITLYRDDLTMINTCPVVQSTKIDFDVNDKSIILIDDVLFTGRTVRCALDELIDLGRPTNIQLAVLIDRGHRELPIHADYVGHRLPTSAEQIVEVRIKDIDGVDEVIVLGQESAPS